MKTYLTANKWETESLALGEIEVYAAETRIPLCVSLWEAKWRANVGSCKEGASLLIYLQICTLEALQLRFRGKVDSTSIFHGKQSKCQRRDQKPLGRNVPGLKGGKGDSESKHGREWRRRPPPNVEGNEEEEEDEGGGFPSWRHSNSQTNCRADRLEKITWSTQSINRKTAWGIACDPHSETSGLSSHERNKFSKGRGAFNLPFNIKGCNTAVILSQNRLTYWF